MRAVALALILLANYFFYAKWDLHYLALIPAASTCDFLFGLGLQSSKSAWVRRLLVTSSIVMNIGLLAVLRYAPAHTLILPLTLSFYVFQALTYTIDIYRGDAKGHQKLSGPSTPPSPSSPPRSPDPSRASLHSSINLKNANRSTPPMAAGLCF